MPLVVTRKVTNVNLLILLVEVIYDIVELMVTKKVNAISFLIYGIKISVIVTYDIIHKLLEHNFMFALAGNDSILTITTEEFLYKITKSHSISPLDKKITKNLDVVKKFYTLVTEFDNCLYDFLSNSQNL
jgi:predicted transcriptional regulator